VCPAAQNTWINFKVDFSAALREFCLTKKTAHQSGFHSANMMIENHTFQGTAEAISQLVVATASDHDKVASVGQLYDSGCKVIFTKDKVKVNKDGNSVMSGICYQQSILWRVDLKEASKTKYNPVRNHAHDTSNVKELINNFHATAFSPMESTGIKSIKNGNSTSWPGLTEQSVDSNSKSSLESTKDVCMIHAG
jgi:hypothetical protein